MTPQEKEMIDGLINRVNNAPLSEKDSEAEQLLQQGLGRNPDALYVLSQTVIVQGYALEQAQRQLSEARAQLDQTRQQVQQPKKSTSFLGSLLGHDDPAPTPPPPPRPVTQPTYSQPAAPAYVPVPNTGYTQTVAYPQAPAPYAPASSFGAGGAGGGFLRGAMQTAAGVAAGALAFQGIESLMHGFGHSAGYGNDQALGGFGPREEIINNYYGDSGRGDDGGRGDSSLSPDIEDRRFGDGLGSDTGDTSGGFASGDDFTGDNSSDSLADNSDLDSSGLDDSGMDDSFSDNSGMDDSSFDSGGDDSSNFS